MPIMTSPDVISTNIQGLRWPAEWEPHSATWLTWPHNTYDWPAKFSPIPYVFSEFCRILTRGETVRLIVKNAFARKQSERILKNEGIPLEKIELFHAPTNRSWIRDNGPIFIKKGTQLFVTDWKFNAWARYPDWQWDNEIPKLIAGKYKIPHLIPRYHFRGKQRQVVLEGGSIDSNGAGTLLTTEECLLSKKQRRNPGFLRETWEKVFLQFFGIRKTIWLKNGLTGDDTHGHVDDLARFVNKNTVVAVREYNRKDINYNPLLENQKILKSARDHQGKQLNIVELPLPKPVYYRKQRLPASYANFYIANSAVLVPVFNDENDRVALTILAEALSPKPVVGIYCRDIILGQGSIHCLTQQQPY